MWKLAAIFVLFGATLQPTRAVLAYDEANEFQALIAKQSPAIVTVKAILKTEVKGESQNSESNMTVQGVVVAPEGIVVISNMPLSPKRLMEILGGPSGADGFDVNVTPTNIKVIFESEEKEYDAFIAATDTKYDIAFIKIEGLGDRKLPYLDFSNSVSPSVGQKVLAVSRLTKGYDYAPFVHSAQICGEVSKPRKAWMIEGNISSFGLPVYLPTGEVVGILSTLPSGVKEDGTADQMGFSMMMRMMGGGGGPAIGAFILPGQPIKALVEQAKAQAVTVAAERAKKAKETKPAAPKKPGGSGTGHPSGL